VREERGPVVLLTEVHYTVRLHAHAQAGPDRHVA
jgi:hypothetical protein